MVHYVVLYTHYVLPPPHDSLRNTEALLLVGTSGVGKSAIARHICETYPEDCTSPTSFTTRSPRPDDASDAYRFLSHEEVASLKPTDIVQYIQHPDGNLYGTLIDEYRSRISVIDAMTSSVDDFRNAGFGRVAVFGIIASSPELQRRLDRRYPPDHPARIPRLTEALTCLLWLQDNPDVSLILNDAPTNGPAAAEVMTQFKSKVITPRSDQLSTALADDITVVTQLLHGQ